MTGTCQSSRHAAHALYIGFFSVPIFLVRLLRLLKSYFAPATEMRDLEGKRKHRVIPFFQVLDERILGMEFIGIYTWNVSETVEYTLLTVIPTATVFHNTYDVAHDTHEMFKLPPSC